MQLQYRQLIIGGDESYESYICSTQTQLNTSNFAISTSFAMESSVHETVYRKSMQRDVEKHTQHSVIESVPTHTGIRNLWNVENRSTHQKEKNEERNMHAVLMSDMCMQSLEIAATLSVDQLTKQHVQQCQNDVVVDFCDRTETQEAGVDE
jgi:hypothetical protein